MSSPATCHVNVVVFADFCDTCDSGAVWHSARSRGGSKFGRRQHMRSESMYPTPEDELGTHVSHMSPSPPATTRHGNRAHCLGHFLYQFGRSSVDFAGIRRNKILGNLELRQQLMTLFGPRQKSSENHSGAGDGNRTHVSSLGS